MKCCIAEAFVLTDAGEEDPGLVDGLPSLCVKADGYLQTTRFLVGEGCPPSAEVPHPASYLVVIDLSAGLAHAEPQDCPLFQRPPHPTACPDLHFALAHHLHAHPLRVLHTE